MKALCSWRSMGCTQRTPNGTMLVTFSCILFIIVSTLGTTLCSSSTGGDEYLWKEWKQNSLGRSAKPRYSSEKQMAVSQKVRKHGHHNNAENFLSHSRGMKAKLNLPQEEKARGRLESSMLLARQSGSGGGGGAGGWGWGWPSSSYGGSGGSYDVYTIIAVAAFAALFGALIYELLGGSSRRSYESTSFSLPPVSLGLDSEKLPEVMVKIGDWIANSTWFDSISNESRTMKALGEKIGVWQWFDAFKKDPVEYQCVRKMACITLAASSLAEKSLKTNFGSVFLSVFGNFIENGNELQDLVTQVVGNPKKCDELVAGGYCEEN